MVSVPPCAIPTAAPALSSRYMHTTLTHTARSVAACYAPQVLFALRDRIRAALKIRDLATVAAVFEAYQANPFKVFEGKVRLPAPFNRAKWHCHTAATALPRGLLPTPCPPQHQTRGGQWLGRAGDDCAAQHLPSTRALSAWMAAGFGHARNLLGRIG